MKLRKLLFAVAILAMASLASAQGVTVGAFHYFGQGANFYVQGLTDHCVPDLGTAVGDGAPDGTPIVLYHAFDNQPYPVNAAGGVGGDGRPFALSNTWLINAGVLGFPGIFTTGFDQPGLSIPNGVPTNLNFYLVVETAFARWKSPTFSLTSGLNDDVTIQTWLPCEELVTPCTPQDYNIHVQNWHTFAPFYQCLHLCPGVTSTVCLHGLKADNRPHVTLIPGCDTQYLGCQETCPPAAPAAGPWFFVPDPLGGPVGSWCITLTSPLEGCVCFCVDFIESAELGSFDAVAQDNSVELAWNTLSESNLASFRVLRDGAVIGNVSAQNSVTGASYTFVDANAVNGTTYTYSLASVNMDGSVEDWGVTVTATPSMNAAVITEYALHQNYPNPFNPTTNIVFDVVSENFVTLTVFNAMGQEVSTLVNGTQAAGRHTVAFDAANLTSGLYFYTVKIGNEFTATKKMMLVK
ncbi:T9SS type A sorting domain-containing protein [bacterium]|nr:T9SS type A sorting domain-containing protein [bacterium]